jgi:hypothetical protein
MRAQHGRHCNGSNGHRTLWQSSPAMATQSWEECRTSAVVLHQRVPQEVAAFNDSVPVTSVCKHHPLLPPRPLSCCCLQASVSSLTRMSV